MRRFEKAGDIREVMAVSKSAQWLTLSMTAIDANPKATYR